jgi:RNA polymerase sigma-70 factor (ECF subfamily)
LAAVTQSSPPPFDWRACIDAARAGSTSALGRLLEACRSQMLAVAARELDADLRAKASPSDLVQETFLDAHRDFSRFIGGTEDAVRAWLHCVLRNNLGDLRQRFREAAMRHVSREESLDHGAADRKAALADHTPSPSSNASRREEAALVEAALAQLPEDCRRVIHLRHREHLSFADVAQTMNRSEEAAKSLWARAIEKLRQILGTKGS